MFGALSRFTIANDKAEQIKGTSLNRPRLVENVPGFLRLDVISPIDNPQEVWLLTDWENEHGLMTWRPSYPYRDSHRRIPKGLKLVPDSVQLRFFDHGSS